MKHKTDKDTSECIMGVMEEAYKLRVRDKMVAVGLIKRGNQKKFEGLMVKIREQYSFDIDVYSKTLSSAYKLMENPSESKIKIDNYRGRDAGRGRGRRG